MITLLTVKPPRVNDVIGVALSMGADVLSVEHEDSLMSADEGLTKAVRFLSGIVIKEKPGAAYWA